MADYQTDKEPIAVKTRKSGAGSTIVLLGIILALIIGLLFATGFWNLDVKDSGSLPEVKVRAEAGQMPDVDVTSKEVIVGTKKTTVEVPTVEVK